MQQPLFFAVLSAPFFAILGASLFVILGTPLFVIPSASPCHPERFPLSSRALPLPVILSAAKDLVPPTGLSGEKILRRLRRLRMTRGRVLWRMTKGRVLWRMTKGRALCG